MLRTEKTGNAEEELKKLERAADEALRDGELGRVSELCREMARVHYSDGKDFVHLLEKEAKTLLTWFKRGSATKVEIRAAPDSCPACVKLHGRVLGIEEALEEMPIPCRECTYELVQGKPGWCRCTYRAIM
jgi:hypothetical protein